MVSDLVLICINSFVSLIGHLFMCLKNHWYFLFCDYSSMAHFATKLLIFLLCVSRHFLFIQDTSFLYAIRVLNIFSPVYHLSVAHFCHTEVLFFLDLSPFPFLASEVCYIVWKTEAALYEWTGIASGNRNISHINCTTCCMAETLEHF